MENLYWQCTKLLTVCRRAGTMCRRTGLTPTTTAQTKKPPTRNASGASNKNLAVSYFHMGKPHTIIGAERFHYRVRDGFGWFPLAMAAR